MREPEDDLRAAEGCLNGVLLAGLAGAILLLWWALTLH